MKTTATITTTLLLSVGLFVAPAIAADEPPTDPACASTFRDGTDLEHSLTNEVQALRLNLSVVEGTTEVLRAQRDLAARRADRYAKKVEHKQDTIDRLRAKLAARR